MTIQPLPETAAAVTNDWLTEVLHDSGALPPGGTITAIEHHPIAEGVGMMSDLARLIPAYAGEAEGAPIRISS